MAPDKLNASPASPMEMGKAWDFTPDGKMLVVTQVNPDTGLDVHILSMERGYGLKPLLQGRR